MHPKPLSAQRDDELFDVVDEQDRVIGRAFRKEVHARNLLHRAVHVLVFNAEGKVFLQKRSLAKDSSPGCWDSSCSGHLDAGETYALAATRELEEEIGVRASPEQLVFQLRLSACAATGWEFVSVYSLRYEGAITINPAEIERGDWFTPAAVLQAISERPHDFTSTLKKHFAVVAAGLK